MAIEFAAEDGSHYVSRAVVNTLLGRTEEVQPDIDRATSLGISPVSIDLQINAAQEALDQANSSEGAPTTVPQTQAP